MGAIVKHMVTNNSLATPGAQAQYIIAFGEEWSSYNPDLAGSAAEVAQGNLVKEVNFDFIVSAVDATDIPNVFYWYIWKRTPGQAIPAPNAWNTSTLRSQILQSGIALLTNLTETHRFRGKIYIPPRMQRFDVDHELALVWITGIPAFDINVFAQFIYKEHVTR